MASTTEKVNTLTTDAYLKILIEQIRIFLKDYAEKNSLLEDQESSDQLILLSIQMTISDYNSTCPPSLRIKKWSDFPSLSLMLYGCTIELLLSNSIWSARNNLSFQDSGGVNINDKDQWQKYPQFIQIMIQKYNQMKSSIIKQENNAGGYGGIDSEYGIINDLSFIHRGYPNSYL